LFLFGLAAKKRHDFAELVSKLKKQKATGVDGLLQVDQTPKKQPTPYFLIFNNNNRPGTFDQSQVTLVQNGTLHASFILFFCLVLFTGLTNRLSFRRVPVESLALAGCVMFSYAMIFLRRCVFNWRGLLMVTLPKRTD
jgi:hypothetical protein